MDDDEVRFNEKPRKLAKQKLEPQTKKQKIPATGLEPASSAF